MATKKFAQLVAVNAGTELLDTNLGATSLNGAGSRKFTWANLATYMKAKLGYGPAAGGALAYTPLIKQVTAILGATDTTVLTVTIPNAAHSALLRVTFLAIKGVGGPIGLGESVTAQQYVFAVTRTPGVGAKMAQVVSAGGSNGALATVTGGTAISATIDDGGMLFGPTGADNAAQTYAIRVNISTGGVNGNICDVFAEILNKNANGITVS